MGEYEKALLEYSKVITIMQERKLEEGEWPVIGEHSISEIYKSRGEAYFGLGGVYREDDKSFEDMYDKAVDDYTKAIELGGADDDEDKLYVFRSQAYFANENYNKALDDINMAIKLNPCNDCKDEYYDRRSVIYYLK